MDVCRSHKGLIGSYVDGTATEGERSRVDEHLATCERCARAAAALKRTRALVAGLPQPTAPPRLMSAVSARLRTQRVGRAERFWWGISSHAWFQPAAVAMVLILCIVVTGTAIYQAGPLRNALDHRAEVAAAYGPAVPGAMVAAADDSVTSSFVASHEMVERDQALGDPTAVMNCAYAP